jgi:hypothetical protein
MNFSTQQILFVVYEQGLVKRAKIVKTVIIITIIININIIINY